MPVLSGGPSTPGYKKWDLHPIPSLRPLRRRHPSPRVVFQAKRFSAKASIQFFLIVPGKVIPNMMRIPPKGIHQNSRTGKSFFISVTALDALATFPSIAQTTHGFQTRAGEAHDIDSLTDTPPSQLDTKKCIQVGSETYAVTSQPRSPYTSHDYDSI